MNKEETLKEIQDMLDNDEVYFLMSWRKDGRILLSQKNMSPMNLISILEAEKFKILSGLRIEDAEKTH